MKRLTSRQGGSLRDLGNLLELGARDVAVGEELGDGGAHREVHVQLALALFQGKLAAAQEGHDALLIYKTFSFVEN
jgi:hypothetical protein